MRWFYRQLRGLREAGEPVVTATVIGVRGSTPRDVGAKMIVRRDGAIEGSVGGGCGEAQVRWDAIRVFDEGRPMLSEIDLTGEMNDESLTHCGGIMEVFLDRLGWDDRASVGLSASDTLGLVDEALRKRRRVALAVVTGGGHDALPPGAKWIIAPDGADGGPALRVAGALPDVGDLAPLLVEAAAATIADGKSRRLWARRSEGRWVSTPDEGDVGLFVEAVEPAPELIVVGAGHIALPLVAMGRLLDFEVTVIDDRAAFANRERFPDADALLVGPVDEELRRRPIGGDTYVVLVTRGHQHDEVALKAVIGSPAAYVGMIGSRRRIREVFRHLAETGVPAERIERVHAPIGLAIGAETPAEIATAIAAELVKVRRSRHGCALGGRGEAA